MMKISKPELIVVLLTAMFLAFSAGWFLRPGSDAKPIRVETQRAVTDAQAVLILPAPTATGTLSAQTVTHTAPPADQALAAGEMVNINTADVDFLQKLPNIGEKRARDIIAYREKNGPFRIPEEITEVPGIGEGILEQIIGFITTGDGT